jgi:hypothetical protein
MLMRRGYKAFLMGTATDLPTGGFKVAHKTQAEVLFEGIRNWGRVVSHLPQ